jgi:Cu2+-containing amine oxidase
MTKRYARAAAALPAAALASAAAAVPPFAAIRAHSLVLLYPWALSRCEHQIEQAFPTAGPEETRWRICWRTIPAGTHSAQFAIGPVYFRKSPNSPFVKVVYDMRVAEFLVPYHPGGPRFHDIGKFQFDLDTLTAADCPPSAGGQLQNANVCLERHDRGLMWKDGFTNDARRGEEIVLWASLDAWNYSYVQSYAFRDDGGIVARAGATGQNYGPMPTTPHAHNALWRVDLDFNGVTNDVALVEHSENLGVPDSTGTDSSTPISVAGSFEWKPQNFTALSITSPTLKNSHGTTSSYELFPLPEGGLSRHSEPYAQADFWVTPYNASQTDPTQLADYVAGSPSVATRDVVLWVKGTVHHHPRSEDGVVSNGQWIGTAHTMWTGFMLMPHNLFDCAPLYKPCP